MHVTPFFVWLITLPLTCAASLIFPLFRAPLFLVLAIHFLLFIRGIFNIRAQFFCACYCRGRKNSGQLALTFDDGPDPGLTPDILNLLNRHAMKATFFVIADKAKRHPEIVRQCFDAGHTIACHDLNHSNFSNFRMGAALIRDLSKAQNIINAIIGKKPLLYRPPVGLMNPHVPGALKKLGMQCIGWSKKASDRGNRRMRGINRIKTLAGAGEVILLHDAMPNPDYKEAVLKQIDDLCLSIKQNEIKTVTIQEMFHIQAYE